MADWWNRWGEWWTRPCGMGYLLRIAVPLMVSTVCYSVMQFCDRLFLFRHSELEAGAIVTVGTLVWALISLPFGMLGYVSTFIAQYRGAGQPGKMGRAVTHAAYLCLLFVPWVLAPSLFAEPLFRWLGHSDELSVMQASCFAIYAWSGIGMVAGGVLDGVLIGLEKNRPVMYANIIGSLVNLVLDPIMIFGWGPIPEMGILGACWATVIGSWVKFAVTFLAIWLLPERSEFQFGRSWKWDGPFLWRFIYYGFPSGFQWAVEGAAMTYFVFVMGKLGEDYLSATSLTFSVNMLAFVPIYGLGMALSAVVGNQLGRNDSAMALRAMGSGLIIGVAFTSFFALVYVSIPDQLLIFHKSELAHFETVAPIFRRFLFFVAIYCVLDAVQIVMSSVLKGAGDTWFLTITICITSGLFLLAGIVLENTSSSRQLAADRWWLLLTCWLSLLAIVYSLRVLQGRWLKMRVIEMSESQ